jgi:hypothetical protein
MRRPGGYGVTKEPGKKDIEEDSFTCAHCNAIVFVTPFQHPADAGGFCTMCMKPLCKKCAALGKCTPFEKVLEKMEAEGKLADDILKRG